MPDYNYEIQFVRKKKDGTEDLVFVFNGPHYAMLRSPGNLLRADLQQLEPTAADPRSVRLKFTFSD